MKIINDELLKTLPKPKRCELCFRAVTLSWHHIYHRKAGGGQRLDVSINLAALCESAFDVRGCHPKAQEDPDTYRPQCLEVVARREGCEPGDVSAVIEAVIRLPKRPSVDDCYDAWRTAYEASNLAARLLDDILHDHVPEWADEAAGRTDQ